MNPFIRWALASLILSGLAFAVVAAEQRTTLTIKADGTCAVVIDKTEPRALVEQQVRAWERYQKSNQGEDDGADRPATPNETRALTDEELGVKIRQAAKVRAEQADQEDAEKIDLLEVKTNTIHSVTARSLSSLEEMLKQSYAIWSPAGFMFENVKFEKDAEGHLRVTLTPSPGGQRYANNLRNQWKLAGTVSEFKVVFPGKVITSGLPQTAENATWIAIDAQKNETMALALKLAEGPTVITAELGGLKLDRPLESKILQQQSRRGGAGPEMPITEAGPGFAAEPQAVTTTTLYYFPGGEKQLALTGSFSGQPTGTVVYAKLFAPKGRTLQSVSGVRVLKAIDDRGREIVSAPPDGGMEDPSGGSPRANAGQIQLRLPLPSADAQSIDELSGEAIAVTAGKWRELTLTNVNESFTNAVDLADLLPGAKLVLAKFKTTNRQVSVQAQLKGAPAIRQIEIQVRTSSGRRGNASITESSFTTRGGEATRRIQVQSYEANREDGTPISLSLVLRFPEDQRRERVRFVLKGLDLL